MSAQPKAVDFYFAEARRLGNYQRAAKTLGAYPDANENMFVRKR